MIITRTEQIWIKSQKTLSWLCHLSKNLYNEGNYLIRQEFFNNGKWIRYNSLYHLLKLQKIITYFQLKQLNKCWKSLIEIGKPFFALPKRGRKINRDFEGNQNLLDTNGRMESLYWFLRVNRWKWEIVCCYFLKK